MKKKIKVLPCATCGNDFILHKDRLQKCPYCGHWNKWDGKQVTDQSNK